MDNCELRLGRRFFERPTALVAAELISCELWRTAAGGTVAGTIVETEAYLDATDLASHAAWSKRGRDVMHREPGAIYIYKSYGIHWMFNIVAHQPGGVGAVLVRAVEPFEGIDIMRARRRVEELLQLASGPGRLCQAFGIDEALHKVDLAETPEIWIAPRANEPDVRVSTRIGITKSAERPLRFYEAKSRYVSAHRRGVPLTSEMLPSQ